MNSLVRPNFVESNTFLMKDKTNPFKAQQGTLEMYTNCSLNNRNSWITGVWISAVPSDHSIVCYTVLPWFPSTVGSIPGSSWVAWRMDS